MPPLQMGDLSLRPPAAQLASHVPRAVTRACSCRCSRLAAPLSARLAQPLHPPTSQQFYASPFHSSRPAAPAASFHVLPVPDRRSTASIADGLWAPIPKNLQKCLPSEIASAAARLWRPPSLLTPAPARPPCTLRRGPARFARHSRPDWLTLLAAR